MTASPCAANQHEEPFVPKHLGNWEQPAVKARRENVRVAPRTEPTRFIVDERGHMLPGVPKKMTAFSAGPYWTPPRWPETADSHCSKFSGGASATLGYKGIVTDYLPRNTTVIRTVLREDTRELLYK